MSFEVGTLLRYECGQKWYEYGTDFLVPRFDYARDLGSTGRFGIAVVLRLERNNTMQLQLHKLRWTAPANSPHFQVVGYEEVTP